MKNAEPSNSNIYFEAIHLSEEFKLIGKIVARCAEHLDEFLRRSIPLRLLLPTCGLRNQPPNPVKYAKQHFNTNIHVFNINCPASNEVILMLIFQFFDPWYFIQGWAANPDGLGNSDDFLGKSLKLFFVIFLLFCNFQPHKPNFTVKNLCFRLLENYVRSFVKKVSWYCG